MTGSHLFAGFCFILGLVVGGTLQNDYMKQRMDALNTENVLLLEEITRLQLEVYR